MLLLYTAEIPLFEIGSVSGILAFITVLAGHLIAWKRTKADVGETTVATMGAVMAASVELRKDLEAHYDKKIAELEVKIASLEGYVRFLENELCGLTKQRAADLRRQFQEHSANSPNG